MKKKILLLGSGGHCKVVLDALLGDKEYKVAGIVDPQKSAGRDVFGVKVIGTDEDLPRFFKAGIKHCFIAAGSIGDASVRVRLYMRAKGIGFVTPNITSSGALVSSRSRVGEGNYIAPGAVINAGASIGNNCIINTGAIIEHDCSVGDHVHISPGAVLNGGVTVGARSHIGSGSVIIQSVKIGNDTVIGAGSMVTKNIPAGVVAYGNPCRLKRAKRNA